jgi:hypothetical protein
MISKRRIQIFKKYCSSSTSKNFRKSIKRWNSFKNIWSEKIRTLVFIDNGIEIRVPGLIWNGTKRSLYEKEQFDVNIFNNLSFG